IRLGSPQVYDSVPDEAITSNGQSRTEVGFSYIAGLGTVHEEGSPHAQENGDDHSVGNIGRSNSAHQRLQGQQPQTPQNDIRPQGEYDNPWEWTAKARALGGPDGPNEVKRTRSKSDASPRGRSSPESDTRPQEDYDQPWKWIKKDRKLSQAVTDQEKGAANADSTPENLRRSTQSPKKPSKELKLDIKPSEINGEPVDPTVTLEHQKWYHGKLSRLEAEKKLKTCNECSYLVLRMSESAAKDFSLSLKSAKGYMHMKIVQHQEGFILGEFSKPFRSIPEMIHYYTRHKLNIRGAEHMALLNPVSDDLLADRPQDTSQARFVPT
ncbi:SH2 domain-containing adapter protein F-like, partial [Amphiura filiformis]|uniref:SH2 domain-containing adapter protein F-like n=1 Tax=Amphiura filiformis TaxID=82378 RepID=UPI003B21A0BA